MNILKLFKKKREKGVWHAWKELPNAYEGRNIVYVCSEEMGFQTYQELYIVEDKDSFEYMKSLNPTGIWAYRHELAEYIGKKYWRL